ncbi:hypothetical protein PENTCL1PPCAC_20652, partial [Pristionchus entomophagus]
GTVASGVLAESLHDLIENRGEVDAVEFAEIPLQLGLGITLRLLDPISRRWKRGGRTETFLLKEGRTGHIPHLHVAQILIVLNKSQGEVRQL